MNHRIIYTKLSYQLKNKIRNINNPKPYNELLGNS